MHFLFYCVNCLLIDGHEYITLRLRIFLFVGLLIIFYTSAFE